VNGNFHSTCTRGFGSYGDELYLAVPSHNPDPRIRLPIHGEHDSEAPIILHGIVVVCRGGDFSQAGADQPW
jgi:hypothetical protein